MVKEIEILLSSVLVGHGCAQHGGNEWRENHCDRYHSCLVSQNHILWDTTAFAYGDISHAQSGADALSLENVGGTREADEGVENLDNKSSGNNDVKNRELSDYNPNTKSAWKEV